MSAAVVRRLPALKPLWKNSTAKDHLYNKLINTLKQHNVQGFPQGVLKEVLPVGVAWFGWCLLCGVVAVAGLTAVAVEWSYCRWMASLIQGALLIKELCDVFWDVSDHHKGSTTNHPSSPPFSFHGLHTTLLPSFRVACARPVCCICTIQ